MDIIVEKALQTDAEAMIEYLKQIGAETDNNTFGKEGLPLTIEEEAECIQKAENSCDSIMLVAKANGRIIGDASLSRLPRRMSHRGEFGISVLKEYWNKGIGSRLLCEIIAFAKANSFEVIDLEVRCDNLPAIHLYQKFGFEKIGTHDYFFKIGNEKVPFDYMCLKL